MNVVDSSGWLEYFAGTPQARYFAEPIERIHELLIPSISLTEVFKKILQERGEPAALQAAAHMQQGRVVDLTGTLAMKAARMGMDFKLPLADSIIYATARQYDAMLWTQDEDFKNLPHVKFIPKTH